MASPFFLKSITIDITPTKKIPLFSGDGPFEKIDSRLECCLFWLKQEEQEIIVASIDTLYINPLWEKKLHNDLSIYSINIPEDHIILNATHTHTAPVYDKSKPLFNTSDKKEIDRVYELILASALELNNTAFEEVSGMYYVNPSVNAGINRRKSFPKWRIPGMPRISYFLPNEKGEVDHTIHRLQFRNTANKIIAEWCSIACHPTAYPIVNNVSADYAAFIRSALNSDKSVGIAIFQGFSAEIRPRVNGKPVGFKEKLKAFWFGSVFAKPAIKDYNAWANSVATTFKLSIPKRLEDFSEMSIKQASLHANTILNNADLIKFIPKIRALHFGQDISLVFCGYEPSCSYAKWLYQKYDNKVIPVGCSGYTLGYLPTEKMIGEGGYEVEGFKESFGIEGEWKKCAEKTFKSSLVEVFNKK